MNILAEFKGQNGKLIVYEDSIVISRNTFGGFLSQGGSSGDRRYFYNDIGAIEYKKPTFIANGYYKIIIQGTNETNAKVGIFSSSSKSAKDQNTVILRAFSKSVGEETDRIYEMILQKLTESKRTNSIPIQQSSKMDELKKLAELKTAGILTEDEFKIEKEKILNN